MYAWLSTAIVAAIVFVASCLPCHAINAAGDSRPDKPVVLPAVRQILDELNIEHMSEIESVWIRFASGFSYKIVCDRMPELARRLDQALLDVGSSSRPPIGDWNMLLLTAENGTSAWLPFACRPSETGGKLPECFVGGTEHSKSFDEVIYDIKRDAKAADEGAQIANYDVRRIVVTLPRTSPMRIPVTSKQGKSLIACMRNIVGWLDVRSIPAAPPSTDDLSQAEMKFGSVCLELDTPVKVQIYDIVHQAEPGPNDRPSGFYKTIVRSDIFCDSIMVMDYGNYFPPVVILHSRHGRYYLFDQLLRRTQERVGVSLYGLKGHPLSDVQYYRSPLQLYKELQELARKACKVYRNGG